MADLQALEDRLAIRDVVERYSVSVTRRDWDEMASCFHENARWHTSLGHDFKTRQGIREGIREVVEAMEFLVQMPHGQVIDDLTADRAKGRLVLNEMGRITGGAAGVFVLGVYDDVFTKIDGRWGFESRFFQAHYLDPAAPPGNIMVDYKAQP
jgi:hypothetical protein